MSTDHKTNDDSSPNVETIDNKAPLHGLVVKLAQVGHVTILSGGITVVARLPVKKSEDEQSIIPLGQLRGHAYMIGRVRNTGNSLFISHTLYTGRSMNLNTGANQIIGECEQHYKTYFFDDGTFSVVSPAAYYVEEGVDEDAVSIAYTPFFKFVDDPKGVLQEGDWLEWYECVLTSSVNSPYLLQVDRIVRLLPGCLEPGAMPGMTPSGTEIAAALEKVERETRNNYTGVREVYSTQLGLCIGHVEYTRVMDHLGKFSAYGSGEGEGRGALRGPSNHNQRGEQAGGSGYGWRGGYGDSGVKISKGALIFSTRGVVISKNEHELFKPGEWITFHKTAKTEYMIKKEKQGQDTYPPYILQHSILPVDHGGKTRRKEGAGKWSVQVLVRTEFGSLRNGGWRDPGFFGFIGCTSNKIIREATKRLAQEKPCWEEMSEQEKNEVLINVWVGLPEGQQMMKLPAMKPFPAECKWEVRDLSKTEFIHDLPLDIARLTGALSNMVL